MKKQTLALVLVLTLLISTINLTFADDTANSEELQGHVFLGGKYLEVGINKYGYFGTKISGGISATPAGFHPISRYGGDIGMQIDGDGWDNGNDPTTGDMFLPGSRYEGYVIGYKNSNDVGATITKNLVMEGNYSSMDSAITTTNTSTGTTLQATTIGSTSDSKAEMTQVTQFEANSKMFKIDITLENTSSEILYDARYTRFVDPEPDYDFHSTFAGISSVTKNPSDTGNVALGYSKGPITKEPFIYYANDKRARVAAENYSMTDPYSPNTYDIDGSVFLKEDVSGQGFLSMTFALGDIAPGKKVQFSMYQSLDPDIDTALSDLGNTETVTGGSVSITVTGSATSLNSRSAILNSTIADDGGSAIIESGFVYSTVNKDPKIGDENVTKSVSTVTGSAITVSLSNLSPNTTHYFNAFATNSVETGYGIASSFTTLDLNKSTKSKNKSSTIVEKSEPNVQNSKVAIIVNGEKQNIGLQEKAKINGVVTNKILVDSKLGEDKINEILKSKDKKSNIKNKIVIPINKSDSGKIIAEMSGNLIKKLTENDFVIEINTGEVLYNLPSKEIDVQKMLGDLSDGKTLEDIKIEIEIETPSDNDVIKFNEKLKNDGIELVIKPISFQVKATYTSKTGKKIIKMDTFNQYVERLISIPKEADVNKITTSVIINSDGSYSHIPTKIILIDGDYYASVKSLTNSIYSVIWNQVEFSDVAKHWSKKDVNDLGSRLIINNTKDNKFKPDNFIKRSEYVSMIVKSLGLLRTDQEKADFSDIYANQSHSDAISIALKYNIIKGYSDNSFKPYSNITREEAFVIAEKALRLAGYNDTSYNDTILEIYSDEKELSSWSRNCISLLVENKIVKGYEGKLSPKEFITNAEAATIVKKILLKMELID